MQIPESVLIEIIDQASTLSEKLSYNLSSNKSGASDPLVDSRIERWCQIATEGNWEQFEKRLAWDDLDLQKVRRTLSSSYITNIEQNTPVWVETFRKCFKESTSVDYKILEKELSTYRYLDPLVPLTFEEVLLPFISVAVTKLKNQVGSSYTFISEDAHASLERSLLRWLSRLCSLSLELEFSIFRAARQSTATRLSRKPGGDCSKKYYREFVNSLFNDGLLKFFQEYPVLARLTAMTIEMWVNATQEFISRLESDKLKIQKIFLNEKETGKVVELKVGLSDRHNNGRSVMVITFSSGLKLVYKPRNLETEKVYVNLLKWINKHEFSLEFRLFKVLSRSTYGWVEFIETIPCKNEEEAGKYYQRMGVLLCLTHILEGTDLHYQNVINCGEHPVLIDLETLMHPRPKDFRDSDNNGNSNFSANRQLSRSVLRTGLLPYWYMLSKNQPCDLSALGAANQETFVKVVQKWSNINTDKMVVSYRDVNIRPSQNTSSLNGVNLSINDYYQEIIDGFTKMYHFLMEKSQIILAPNSPLATLAHQEVRFVFRATITYGSIFFGSLHPEFLRNGVDWSMQFDILSRAMLLSDSKPYYWPLLKIETQMMEQMDIPLFVAHSNDSNLNITPHQTIKKYFKEPSFNCVLNRINKLSYKNLKQQVDFIRSSLYTHTAHNYSELSVVNDCVNSGFDTFPSLEQLELAQEAIRVATKLKDAAIIGADRSATWIAPQFMIDTSRFQLKPMNYNLFDGSCGVAFFLAALEKVTGGAGFKYLALSALQPLLQDLQKVTVKENYKRIGIGGAVGLGSIIYALTHISQFLNKPSLVENASQLAFLIASDSINADDKFNIFSGSAGTILGLLALYRISADSKVLQKAIACGYHLVNNRITVGKNYKSWKIPNGKSLVGFLNGVSGISYALLLLYQASEEMVFLKAAQESIIYERSVLNSKKNNELNLQPKKDPFRDMLSWSCGEPGIALARVAELDILDIPEIREDIKTIVKSTKQQRLLSIDNIQHGNLGLVEFLLTTGRRLSQPELLKIAMTQSNQVIARSNHLGNLAYDFPLTFHPGFFQGSSGIGYEFLRLAYPDILPSVLLWE